MGQDLPTKSARRFTVVIFFCGWTLSTREEQRSHNVSQLCLASYARRGRANIEADQGYIGGDPEYFVTPNGMGPGRQAEKRLQEKKRIDGRTETFNTNWTSFACFSRKPFRHTAIYRIVH